MMKEWEMLGRRLQQVLQPQVHMDQTMTTPRERGGKKGKSKRVRKRYEPPTIPPHRSVRIIA